MTYSEADDEAFYFSGLVADGSFFDMDEYDQEAVIKYGKMMYDYGKSDMVVKTENDKLFPSGGLRIPFEVAHGITKETLIDSRNYMQSELDKWEANPKDELNPNGYWMHPEDIINNKKYIRAMNLLIDYFGGE